MDSEIKDDVRIVSIPAGRVELSGEYMRARAARGFVVLLCANRGNVRRSVEVSLIEQLHRSRIIALRVDLLTAEEAVGDLPTEPIRHDVDLLAERVRAVHRWAEEQRVSQGVALGYYGSGATACAALRLASKQQPGIDALIICEVKSDLDSRPSQPPLAALHEGKEPDAELLCDLFRNWLWWESNSRARLPRPRPRQDSQDRPSAAP
jgi:hypothetical protein